MRSKLLVIVTVAAAVAGAAYSLSSKTETGPDPHVAKATRGTLVKTLRLAGQTSARNFVNINAPTQKGPESNRSLILLKLVKAGSFVKKGELIATIDAQSVADHVDDVADMVRQADADMRKRKSEQQIEWETLQQTLRQSKSDMEKAKLDAKTTVLLTDIERELLELNAEETAARYKQLQQDLVFHRAGFDAEIRILEYTKERQQRHHDRHANDLKSFTIYAPLSGLAVMQQIFRGGEMGQVREGDQVWPGMLFMKVVNPASMQVEAKANQAESSDLRVGQKVKIGLDAFPGVQFDGRIYSIGALAAGGWMQSAYVRSVPVNIQIDGADPRLIPDLSASCDVVLESAENAVSIPLSAIHEESGKFSVLVRRGPAFEEQPITVGLRNAEFATVLSGLKAGEEVRVN